MLSGGGVEVETIDDEDAEMAQAYHLLRLPFLWQALSESRLRHINFCKRFLARIFVFSNSHADDLRRVATVTRP